MNDRRPLESGNCGAICGDIHVPGDKSISHRALILGGLATGKTIITGLLEGEDVLATADVMRALGAEISKLPDGSWEVMGVGVGGLAEPDRHLDFGNSGTGVRLMMGLIATHPITATLTGDASLSVRPMRRVLGPLSQFGAQWTGPVDQTLPGTLSGTANPLPVRYQPPEPSAQVKSAILLAGLNTPGTTTVVESEPSRDHTERMLGYFGAEVTIEDVPEGKAISINGYPELVGRPVEVPGDPSSAAFPCVAALIRPGSRLFIRNILVNPTRTGLFTTLQEMGGKLRFENIRDAGGDKTGDLIVEASALQGIEVPPERAVSMIDEYPVLAVAAAYASGKTTMRGAAELRVKESDRIATTVAGLRGAGVEVEEFEDGLEVTGVGAGQTVPGGGTVVTHLDHRIAMSFLILGMGANRPVSIDDAAPIATSFPAFQDMMQSLGARFTIRNHA